jgi:hypothetical protein
VSPLAMLYTPQFPLYSDDADKQRWLYLPECDPQIDNSDEDNWVFPVGTRAWKEFSLNGTLLETRLMHRYGPGPTDILFATYQWRQDASDADLVFMSPLALPDVNGTTHDIPPGTSCTRCHGKDATKGGLPSRFLGASAIQLSHNGPGLTMATLSNGGMLTVPNPAGYTVPGDATAQAALGYIHSNCGNCHNETADGLFFPNVDMRLKVAETTVEGTGMYQAMVNQPPQFWVNKGCNNLITGGDPADSCVRVRMNIRAGENMLRQDQMPPIGTNYIDAPGLGIVDAWINTLPPPQ